MASRRAASTASRASARRSSIIAARAGGRSRPRRPRASRVGRGLDRVARRRETRGLDLVGPVEPDRHALGADAEIGGHRLVEDPEQAALEVHRQPPVLAHRVELDRDAGPSAALARRAPQRRDQAEVVEDHRPDVEDERLGRLERLLDHRHELADLAVRPWPGRVVTSRSTIWAWRTMLVRLWAGPSCIARAISRRRSSWAPSSEPRDRRRRRRRRRRGASAAAPRPQPVAAGRRRERDVAGRAERLDIAASASR